MVRKYAVWIAMAMLSSAACADMLNPGETQYKNHPLVGETPTYSPTPPPFAGGDNRVGFLPAPMQIDFEGQVTSEVFADPSTGFLSFHYTISLTDMNTQPIVRATMNGWSGITITDAGADASGSSGTFDTPEWTDGDPIFIGRSQLNNGEGLEFQFRSAVNDDLLGTVIGPGDLSSEIFIVTNMTDFTTGNIALIDTAQIGRAAVLIPVPEPASLFLLLGAAAIAIRSRRLIR